MSVGGSVGDSIEREVYSANDNRREMQPGALRTLAFAFSLRSLRKSLPVCRSRNHSRIIRRDTGNVYKIQLDSF